MERTIWKTEKWVEGAKGMKKKESYKEILVCLLLDGFLKTGNNEGSKNILLQTATFQVPEEICNWPICVRRSI
jgi:hypothetical protein